MTFFKENENKSSLTPFEEIALPHMSYIFKIAYRMSGNKAAAEDLTQETFFIAMQKFDQLKEQAKCKSWLFVILRNLYLGTIEKTKNKYFLDFDDMSFGIADDSDKVERQWREGFSDEVQHQLDRLDDKYKRPLEMAVLGDYSYKEIASKLDIPIGTVMSRIARGKIFLRRELMKSKSFDSPYAVGFDIEN
jgi:RNA polymerase sigma-70 factor (ECF subfamily)